MAPAKLTQVNVSPPQCVVSQHQGPQAPPSVMQTELVVVNVPVAYVVAQTATANRWEAQDMAVKGQRKVTGSDAHEGSMRYCRGMD